MTIPAGPAPAPVPVVLTVAGSDPTGGAGVQADLSTFAAHGTAGRSVVTALTAQGAGGVTHVHLPPTATVLAQLDALLADGAPAAVKVGMTGTAAVVGALGDRAARGRLPALVVDPVLLASTGRRLTDVDALHAYRERLLPWARVVTPNLAELAALVGRPVEEVAQDPVGAAVDLAGRCRRAAGRAPDLVVVTGGDRGGLDGRLRDVVVDTAPGSTAARAVTLVADRVATGATHGTGCAFSSATAAGLALGRPPADAVRAGRAWVHHRLRVTLGIEPDPALGPASSEVGVVAARRRR